MEMELEFFDRCCVEQKPKLLEHIQGMSSGNAPFFPTTLSLIYEKLFGKAFAQSITPSSGLDKLGNQSAVGLTPSPVSLSTAFRVELLKCGWCGARVGLKDLHNSFHCPHCPPSSIFHIRPFMQCPLCDHVRECDSDSCFERSCGVRFM